MPFILQIGNDLPGTKRSLQRKREAVPTGEGNYIKVINYDLGFDALAYVPLVTDATAFTITPEGRLSARSPATGGIDYAATLTSDAIKMLAAELYGAAIDAYNNGQDYQTPQQCSLNGVTHELTCVNPRGTTPNDFYTCVADAQFNNNPLLGDMSIYTDRGCVDAPFFAIPVANLTPQVPVIP